MRFAHMKRIFRLDRLRLRGLSGARDEVLLTATAQNLRRLVKFLCRPPPLVAQALSRIAGVAGDLMACKNGVALELAECGHQIGDQIITILDSD